MLRRLALFLLSGLTAVDAFARAGGGGGFHSSSGGGSFSGGGFSSSGGSGGSDFGLFNLYFYMLMNHPIFTLALTGFVIYLFINSRAQAARDVTEDGIGGYVVAAAKALGGEDVITRTAALAAIRARDPAFDEAAFLARTSAAFLVIQEAWSAQDMGKARPFISDGVFERFGRQIAEQKLLGVRDRMADVRVLQTEALGYVVGPHFDAAYVRIRAAATDQTLRVADGTLVEDESGEFQEVWTFLRRPGAKTLARPGLLEGQCPSCGAPLAIADATQCAACKTWVNSGEHDWVLVMITQPSVWSFPEERDVDGWAAFRAKDPELSLESLEDRASRAFWRWIDARRRGDVAPLRGIATAEFVAKPEALAGSRPQSAAVGLVTAVSLESRGDEDFAHIKVRWEAEFLSPADGSSEGRDQREHFFIFRRKAGVTSAAKAALSSGRCPSCGAPSEQADAEHCAYCKRPFNDGSVSWVLDAIVPYGEWHRPAASPVVDKPAGGGYS